MLQKFSLLASLAGGLIAISAASAPAQETAGTARGGWAVVAADGSLRGYSNVRTVKHTEIGVYHVLFGERVSACAANATIQGAAKALLPGYILVTKRSDGVTVHTYDVATLLPADFAFNLNVNCS